MIGIDVLKPAQAASPEAQDAAPATITYPVPCERCGRVVRVALNAVRAPGFHHLAEQASCPDIQERRTRGDGGLLLMMCGPLKQSLDASCNAAEVEATAPVGGVGQVVCSIPGVSIAQYAPDEARSRADILQAQGFDKLAGQLRKAAAAAEHTSSFRKIGAAAGVGGLVIAAASLWLFMARAPGPSASAPPQVREATDTASDQANATPPLRMVATQAISPAPAIAPSPGSADDQSDAVTSEASSTPQAIPLVADAAPSPAPAPGEDPARIRLPDIVMIPGGTFTMGGTESSELPAHRVTVKPFALGKYPVTIGEWKQCVADKACADVTSGPDDNPVTNVNYEDASDYLAWLSRTVGKPFRLPTEAEWEYAARGGASTKFWWGDQMRTGMANCNRCNESGAPAQLMKVGSFPANPFGLHDMGGGVDQWVADTWHKNYQGAPSDGSAWTDEQSFVRVLRSGSWKKDASYARSGSRDRYDGRVRYPTHGFRVALSL